MQNDQHIGDEELASLVFNEFDDSSVEDLAGHVESCEACRTRLDLISGSKGFDQLTKEMLETFPEMGELTKPKAVAEIQPAVAAVGDYFEPPTHPEMLGRLGRYDIESLIGAGVMGVVFKGFDTELNRPIAIKVLARHLSFNGTSRQRFAREAKAAAAVVHEHVIAIHNVETQGTTPFLVMPYVAGESLQSRVDRQGTLEMKEILRIGVQTASALEAAHKQGVIHRDIKPANIMLERGGERALVMDFGLAQIVDEASLTMTGIVAGTPSYMSPEQATGKAADFRSDLFSLGCVLYFMATGNPPFRAEKAMGVLNRICHETHTPVWQLNSDVSDELSDLIDRLLEKKPAHRFSSASDVKNELSRTLVALQQPRSRHMVAFRRSIRRNKANMQIAFVLMLFFALIPFVWSAVLSIGAAVELDKKNNNESENRPVQRSSGSEQKTEFTVDAWQQVTGGEAESWTSSVREMKLLLDQAERRIVVGDSVNDSPTHSQWNVDVGDLHQRLQQYENNNTAPR